MPKVGFIRTATSLGWDLHFARQNELDEGGRRIVFATDRPIGFWEARNQPRTMDYPFTILEMHLDKDDKGEGKILAGTRIYIDKKNNLVLEKLWPATGSFQRDQEGQVVQIPRVSNPRWISKGVVETRRWATRAPGGSVTTCRERCDERLRL
jgi:hypothetical protein